MSDGWLQRYSTFYVYVCTVNGLASITAVWKSAFVAKLSIFSFFRTTPPLDFETYPLLRNFMNICGGVKKNYSYTPPNILEGNGVVYRNFTFNSLLLQVFLLVIFT